MCTSSVLQFLLPCPRKQESKNDITKLKVASHSEMPNFGSDVHGFTDNRTTQKYATLKTKMKQIQLHLP